MKQLRIIIIGGGIAGLTAAFCLGRAGHQVIVLERHDKISEIGAGIQIGPSTSASNNQRGWFVDSQSLRYGSSINSLGTQRTTLSSCDQARVPDVPSLYVLDPC